MNTRSNNIYQSYYHHHGTGNISRRGRDIVIALHKPTRMEIHIDASTITSVVFQTVRSIHKAVVTVALTPTILEHVTPDLLSMLKQQRYTYNRSDCLLGSETHMTGSCLAHCLTVDSSLPALTFQRYLRSITSSTAILTSAAFTSVAYPRSHFRDVLTLLHTAIEPMHLGFACQFQIQALWTNAYLSPAEVHRMVPAIKSIKKVSGEAFLTRALGRLRTQLREAD